LQDAKNAFKEMLESHKIGLDWTWEQSMKKIINDKRYGALKTLGEKKQAFNEVKSVTDHPSFSSYLLNHPMADGERGIYFGWESEVVVLCSIHKGAGL
jgi:hypothetical protein